MQVLPKPRPRIPFAYFATGHLELKLYDWQVRMLVALEHKRVSAVVCNGGGKSSVIIAGAVLAFLYNFPKGKIAITSGSFMQLSSNIWPALMRYRSLPYFKGWEWNQTEIKTPQGGFAHGFSTDQPDRLEGWHQDLSIDSPMMYIIDEAKAISDEKFQGIMRCTPTFYLQTSSACPAEGFFYNSFSKYKSIFWTIKISSKDCPHITDEQREIDRVTLNREVYAMKHESEFSEDLSGSAISLRMISTALERQVLVPWNNGPRTAFCDFAAGGDENVLALRDGNKVELIACWRDRDTTQACRDFIIHFKRLKLHPSEIFGDVGGLGLVMINQLKDMGWRINEVNNGDKAEDEEHYANRGAEIWFEAARMIEHGLPDRQFIIIPNDKLFIEQATSRKRKYDTKLRLKLESKEDMHNDGKPSPDRADAIFGAMVCRCSQWNPQTVAQVHMPHNMFATRLIKF